MYKELASRTVPRGLLGFVCGETSAVRKSHAARTFLQESAPGWENVFINDEKNAFESSSQTRSRIFATFKFAVYSLKAYHHV